MEIGLPEGIAISRLEADIPIGFMPKFEESMEIFEKLYNKDKSWTIAYSGGKDSTALTVLALFMKSMHPDINLRITYSDTMMEIPEMSSVAHNFLDYIRDNSASEVTIVKPAITDTYWVRMIGRGYPPPSPRFRWCTDKIKIKPSRKISNDKGIFITGMRVGESRQRDAKIKNSCLSPGASECGGDRWISQKGIDVAAPIINWTSFDVWYFLQSIAVKYVPAVKYVIDLYGNTTMRFGCWMCTVVQRDKTMETMAKSGNEKIRKMLAFRQWLVEEARKPENRYMRKNGIKGRMRKEFRKDILKKIITLEKEINLKLINDSEIEVILRLLNSNNYAEY
ncbi:phosphoadenosine phosphosulfate reductase family protein [Acidiplasma sp. MBA-1]|uniref:phosphoadenosine phosphosulfate reductase domain-containing protein n=1 Tax=Acidiplasma sp. MBA-1 TaxID=1293648 RepID=UPI0005E71CE7|nr:phosphoadenosine phosphosulfate reductase family protein [Acidiplasma sp. MBA-1]KJE49327.1 hypothetical protein TZ01_04545 [Acidiplasma sp. MBA-1]